MAGTGPQEPSIWRRWWKVGLIVGLVLVVIIALGARWIYSDVTTCGTDVARVDDECVGVTDGSTVLAPEFADILGRIKAENDRVLATGQPWVSAGYLLPMPTPGSPTALEVPVLRHELEGALVGQLAANGPRSGGAERPLVRLLVANVGDSSQKWGEVVPTLEAMAREGDRFRDDHLVTVVATGQSLTTMQQALTSLTNAGVPVITSRLTADQIIDIPNRNSPLARIAPLNTDEATAIAGYARSIGPRGLLVQNADPNDTYASSLGDAFRRAFGAAGGTLAEPTETYYPRPPVGAMKSVLDNVCAQRPNVVFFAGRASELLVLVEALPTRTCLRDQHITVVTADDAVDFAAAIPNANAQTQQGLTQEANASIYFSGEASPGTWTDPRAQAYFSPGALTYLRGDCSQCFGTVFRGETLDDGGAIMGHDAVTTATSAIRLEGVNDNPAAVAQALKRLHGPGPGIVPLASGWLSVRASGELLSTTANPVNFLGQPIDATGAPVAKAVPILQVLPGGQIGYIETRSSGPTGVPCVPNAGTC